MLFLLVFNVLGTCRGVHVWSHASYAEAWLFQKKSKQLGGGGGVGWWYTFLKNPLEFFIFILYMPWIFHKIVLDPLEIPRPKTETPGNSTWFFLGHPWKFHFVFNWPLELPHAISLIPLEIPYPQPPCLDFFWNSPIPFSATLLLIPIRFSKFPTGSFLSSLLSI